MPAVNDVGEPCAGEPHARFDGRGLETGGKCCRTAPAPDPTWGSGCGAARERESACPVGKTLACDSRRFQQERHLQSEE